MADQAMSRAKAMVVATAGHVDHGKTALVRALTGIDTDRLPDEKRRGLTIDLGFAYAPLDDGTVIGFVDVPGHERFLHNMLAGVLSMDCVLLVVAADDGPMPQTREHLAILDLIGVPELTAVVTKIDRVAGERVAAVEQELRGLLARAGFGDSPIFAVSSRTAAGIGALRAHIEAKARAWRPRPPVGGFRMPIDRSFVLTGVGVVVTGTVAAGQVAVGDRLFLTPRRLAVRVRSIHAQNQPAEAAMAGDRCALALAGSQLDKSQVERGDWLVAASLHAPVQRFDASVRTVGDGPGLRHGGTVHVHIGTADLVGRVTVLSGRDIPAGADGHVQLVLTRATAALFGDRLVIRDQAAQHTLAGGHVVDPFPPPRRRARGERLAIVTALDRRDPADAFAALLEVEGCVDLQRYALARNLSAEALDALVESSAPVRIGRAGGMVAVSAGRRAILHEALLDALGRWHAAHPDTAGPRKAELLRDAGRPEAADVLEAALFDLVAAGRVTREQAVLRLPEHRPRLAAKDEAMWQRIAALLEAGGLRPPRLRELAEALALPPEEMEKQLVRFERFGRVLRVAENRFFLPPTVLELGGIAAALAAESEDGTFTAASFKDRSGIGRNLTIQVLEFLDRIGVTRRGGEARQVIRSAEDALG